MESKKSQKANLEHHRNSFFMVGMVVAVGLIMTAFNWSSVKKVETSWNKDVELIEIENMPIIEQKAEPPKPKIKVVPPMINEITEVSDETTDIPDIDFTAEIGDFEDFNLDFTDPTETPTDEPPRIIAEVMPYFPGGTKGLMKYISKHVDYPEEAKTNDVTGTVYLTFVVSKTGKVMNVKITKKADPLLNKAALDVVKNLPDFTPGKQNGVPVSVYFSLPIVFKLN